MQMAAEAAKRREEEILRTKTDEQQQKLQEHKLQQQKLQADAELTKGELKTAVDISEESVEKTVTPEIEEISAAVSGVPSTGADEDVSAEKAASSAAGDSEQTETSAELPVEDKVLEDVESDQKLSETSHHETEHVVMEGAGESAEKPENLEIDAAEEPTIVEEVVPVVVVASSDGEVVLKADVSTQSDLHPAGTEVACSGSAAAAQEQSPEFSSEKLHTDQLTTDTDKLDVADDIRDSVSDESSDAYTDVLEDETDHLSDILEAESGTKQKKGDIEYMELCDESSSTVEPNATKEDNKEETEKELDSILDDVHLDESEHGNYRCDVISVVLMNVVILCYCCNCMHCLCVYL